jgi:hypothetical protein
VQTSGLYLLLLVVFLMVFVHRYRDGSGSVSGARALISGRTRNPKALDINSICN